MSKAKRSKYGAKPTIVDGIRFDSMAEAHRYGQLKLMEKAGAIGGLRVHTRWPLHVQEKPIGHYESDFDYWEVGKGDLRVIEDVKGICTPMAKWKIRHFEAEYRCKVRIITKHSERESWEQALASQRSA